MNGAELVLKINSVGKKDHLAKKFHRVEDISRPLALNIHVRVFM